MVSDICLYIPTYKISSGVILVLQEAVLNYDIEAFLQNHLVGYNIPTI